MAKRITACLYIRDTNDGELLNVMEVTANSKIRCKKVLQARASGLQFYTSNPDRFTVSAFVFKKA